MILIHSLIPIYIVGNLHCLGMCGPMMLLFSKNPNSIYYIIGRNVSFALFGGCCGYFHVLVSNHVIARYLQAACLVMMATIACSPWFTLTPLRFMNRYIQTLSPFLTRLSQKTSAIGMFTMGACSFLIPCTQSIMVFSAITIHAQSYQYAFMGFWMGVFNGGLFALLTSPSLMFVRVISNWLKQYQLSEAIYNYVCLCVFIYFCWQFMSGV